LWGGGEEGEGSADLLCSAKVRAILLLPGEKGRGSMRIQVGPLTHARGKKEKGDNSAYVCKLAETVLSSFGRAALSGD